MRLMIAGGMILAALTLASCSGSGKPAQQTTKERVAMSDELVPGYTGGCKGGFTIYSQRQFTPYGTMIRQTLDRKGESVGLRGNDELRAVGWTRTEHMFYPNNPEGLQGKIWFYVPELPDGGSGWVPDAGVRAVITDPAPDNADEYFDPKTQAAPQSPECELFPR